MIKRIILTILLSGLCSLSHAAGILVMGDSISAGYGIQEKDGWVHLLSNQLHNQGHDKEVINASISGETSGGGNARLPKLLKLYEPELVIIELGGNDGLRGYPISSLKDNLQTMISNSQNSGAKVLLLGMQIPPNYGSRYARMFSELYGELAESNNLVLTPSFLQAIASKPHLMQSDGIHPTAEAQPLMLDIVWDYLSPLIVPE